MPNNINPDHIADATEKAKPAPAPLPTTERVDKLLIAIRGNYAVHVSDELRAHISDLTRRLAEAGAELAEVRSRNGMLAVQRADAVHLAKANPTQAYQRIQQFKERAESAEARVRELEREACEALAGAHAEQEVSRHWKEEAQWEQTKRKCAEARVAELVAEAAKRPLASDDEQTIADLEAFKARVMEWARGRCGACGHEGSEGDTCYDCNSDDERSNWTPPQAWEVGE